MSDPKRPPTAQEYVLGQLRQSIVARELEPGAPIRQDALADQLGTSRVPLREALKILEGEGLVTYHPHRGYFVAELSIADLVEVYRIRKLLESEAVSLAAKSLTDETLGALAAALARCERAGKSGDLTELTAANREFHFLIFDAAGMPRLLRLIRVLWDSTDAYRSLYYAEARSRKLVDTEHRQILAALRKRDGKSAVKLLDEHRQHAVDRLEQLLT